MPTKSKSSIITEQLTPVHPGEVLEQEFLIPMELSAGRVARDLGVPAPRINDIVLRRRSVTADTALRLAKYFGTSATFWLGLQNDYDLAVQRDILSGELDGLPRVDLTHPAETRGRRRAAAVSRAAVTTRSAPSQPVPEVRKPAAVAAFKVRGQRDGKLISRSATVSRAAAKKK